METELFIVPVIIGLVEVFKKLGMPSKFAPLVAVVLGALSVLIVANPFLVGIIYGLTACGLYSGVKASSGIK